MKGFRLMKKINIDKASQKELDRIDVTTRRRIINGIMGLTEEPPKGDIKSLKGALQGFNRLRVGSWRITYRLALDMLSAQQTEDFDYYSFEDIKAIGEARERVSAGNCLSFSSSKEMAAYFGV
jgi:mRNA interferase RelE/StbE